MKDANGNKVPAPAIPMPVNGQGQVMPAANPGDFGSLQNRIQYSLENKGSGNYNASPADIAARATITGAQDAYNDKYFPKRKITPEVPYKATQVRTGAPTGMVPSYINTRGTPPAGFIPKANPYYKG